MEEEMKAGPAAEERPETSPETRPQTAADAAPEDKPGVFAKKEIRFALAALLALAVAFAAWYLLQPKLVAARVNGEAITRAEYVAELERQGGRQVLDDLITDRLIVQEASRAGVTVEAAAVNAEVEGLKTGLAEQGQTLDAYLASQNIGVEFLSERIRLRLLLEGLLADRLSVTEEDVDAFIEENGQFLTEDMDPSDETFRAQVRSQLEQQRFGEEAGAYLDELRAAASIEYVNS